MKVTKIEVKYLSEFIVTVHVRMRMKGQSPVQSNQQPEIRFNLFTFVVHKTEEGWSCAAAHNTDIIPVSETNLMIDGNLKPTDYSEK